MSLPAVLDAHSDTELKLQLATAHALSQPREGPWYAVYGLLPRSLENVERGESSKIVTVIFPQHPVTIMVTELDDDPEPSSPQACTGDIVTPIKERSSPTLLASVVGRTGDLQSSPPDPLLLTCPDDNINPVHRVGRLRNRDIVTTVYQPSSPDPISLLTSGSEYIGPSGVDADITAKRVGPTCSPSSPFESHLSPSLRRHSRASPRVDPGIPDGYVRYMRRRRVLESEEPPSPEGAGPSSIPTFTTPSTSVSS